MKRRLISVLVIICAALALCSCDFSLQEMIDEQAEKNLRENHPEVLEKQEAANATAGQTTETTEETTEPDPTNTPTPTPSPEPTDETETEPEPTETPTPTPSSTPTPTPSPTPTSTPTPTPTSTPTPKPTSTPTPTPTPKATPTATTKPTTTAKPTAKPKPTATPTSTPTPTPTEAPKGVQVGDISVKFNATEIIYKLPSGYSFVSEGDEGFEAFKAYGDSLVFAVKSDTDPNVAMAVTLCKDYVGDPSKFVSDFSAAMVDSYKAAGIDSIADSKLTTLNEVKYDSCDIYVNGDTKLIYRSVCFGEGEVYHILAVGTSLDDLSSIFSGFN